MANKIKVLFICLGNICRSPAAEILFAQKIQLLGMQEFFEIDSCGIGNWHKGEMADERMRQTASENGLDIKHLARQITLEDFKYFDYLLVMDYQNLKDVKDLCNQHQEKIFLISDFTQDYLTAIIPDPYFDSMKGFKNVFNLLDKVTLQVANTIIYKHFQEFKS